VLTSVADYIGTGISSGIVGAVLYAILRGHLVPRRTVEDMRKDKDAQIVELGQVVDLWRNTALAKDQAIRELIPMLTEIVEDNKLILKILAAIQEVSEKTSKGGVS
jgi:hypothetical protein